MGFAPHIPKPAVVLFHYHPMGLPVYPPLGTLGLIFYTAFFVAVTLLTIRRPALGACVLVAVVPFALYQVAFGETIRLPKVAVLAVLLGLCAHPGAFAPLRARVPLRILTAGLWVLFATLVSFVHAAHTVPVVRETFKTVEYLLIFSAAVAAYRLDPDRRALAVTFLGTAIAVAVLALAQEIAGAPSALLVNGYPLPRIAGPLEGPNQLAGYFDVAIPIALAFAALERSRLARVALFFMVCADVLTFSRGGLIGAAAGLLVVAIVVRARVRSSIAPIAGGIVVGIAVILAWGVAVHSLGMLRWWNWQSSYAGGVGTRSELWHAAVVLWMQHPVFGIGAGNFELDIPLTGLRGVRTHANSLYLQSLVEGGIPLFAATAWLVYTSISAFVRERLESPFVTAALAAGAALALHQVVDFLTFYPKVGGEWWVLMGIAAAELAVAVRVSQPACA